MYGYIYLTTNLVNGKRYIGRHKSNIFDPTYIGSGIRLGLAINKYGRENFKTEILEECTSETDLNLKEEFYIKKFNAVEDTNFYNIQHGGYIGNIGLKTMYNPTTDEVIMCAESDTEHYVKLGYILGMRPHSDEAKINYRKAKANKIPITDGHITKYIDANDLTLYEAKGYRKGRNKPTRPNQKPEHRKWMNKDGKSIMVKGKDVQSYLDNGYKLGRTKFKSYNRDFDKHPVWNKGKKLANS